MSSPSVSTLLRDHTCLSLTSFDRLYPNGYIPVLQSPGQLVVFCHEQLGARIPSPALFGPLRDRYVAAFHTDAEQHQVPLIQFRRGQRKDDVAAGYRARFHQEEGVVFIGVAQEKASSFRATRQTSASGGVWFTFSRPSVAVNHIHFYVQDVDGGPACVKIGTYLPYPVRVCLKGHEWAKQQLQRAGVAFTALDNGFRWCADPAYLQQVCDALSPADVQAFFTRWQARLPWPLSPAIRAAGYQHKLSLWQVASRPAGFRHRDLRPLVAGLLGRDPDRCSTGAMTYDLRRLRLHGLIERVPHSFRYQLTPDGLRLAFGISRIVLRLLQPQWQESLAPCPELPAPLREACARLDTVLDDLRDTATAVLPRAA